MSFFERISSLCKERGTSPSAVAREIGLNNSSATYWKRGSIPKGDTLQKLADYFRVSVDYLLGKEDPQEAKDLESYLSKFPQKDRELIEMFLKLGDPARSALLGYAERLAEEFRSKPSEQIPMDIDSQLEMCRRGMLMGIATVQANYSLPPEDFDVDSVTLTPELSAMIEAALEKQRRVLEEEMRDSE